MGIHLTLISFYRNPPGTQHYTKCGERLLRECKRYGVPHVVEEIPAGGSWLENANLKPNFIRRKHKELGPVLWVDVDCPIGGNPCPVAEETLGACDVAVPMPRIMLRKTRTVDLKKLPEDDMKATVLTSLRIMDFAHAWGDTEGARTLLDDWCAMSAGPLSKIRGDHRLLQLAMDRLEAQGKLEWEYLPQSFSQRGPLVKLRVARGLGSRKVAIQRALRAQAQIRRNHRRANK